MVNNYIDKTEILTTFSSYIKHNRLKLDIIKAIRNLSQNYSFKF